ncbi:MAG: hypothetical protein MMC33_000696 [Icmadophila ericetorum]|nr:hypothetical protein [Icmadophila ericetorum]
MANTRVQVVIALIKHAIAPNVELPLATTVETKVILVISLVTAQILVREADRVLLVKVDIPAEVEEEVVKSATSAEKSDTLHATAMRVELVAMVVVVGEDTRIKAMEAVAGMEVEDARGRPATLVVGMDICHAIARRVRSATTAVKLAISAVIVLRKLPLSESATSASSPVMFKHSALTRGRTASLCRSAQLRGLMSATLRSWSSGTDWFSCLTTTILHCTTWSTQFRTVH